MLLSPDFIVDANGQAFIEEMNVNGFMVGDDHFYHGQQDTVDALRVLGADGWPKRPLYEPRASRLVDGFVREQGYDAHDEVSKSKYMAVNGERVCAGTQGAGAMYRSRVAYTVREE